MNKKDVYKFYLLEIKLKPNWITYELFKKNPENIINGTKSGADNAKAKNKYRNSDGNRLDFNSFVLWKID